jgi:uncharacterized membrane-anchored protein YjiN (DUF445 family)
VLTEEVKQSRLRRMKATATGCLIAAGGLYVVGLQLDGTAAGYLTAGAEAAMVGGLADWFAVTALFRRPLRLPLPHTALIPRQKDELALRLGEYVTSEFLTSQAVVAQLEKRDVVERLAAYLADAEHAARLAREVVVNAALVLDHLPDEDVVVTVNILLRHDLERRAYAPVLGRLMERAVAGEVQRPLVDLVAGRSHRYLRGHRAQLLPGLRDYLEQHHPVLDFLVTDRRLLRVLDSVAETLARVESDQRHPLRVWVNGLLADLAKAMQDDAKTQTALQEVLLDLLDDPLAQAALRALIADALSSVRTALADPDQELLDRAAALVVQVARRVSDDPALRERLRRTVADLVTDLVDRYGDQLTELIHSQVVERDATVMSRRIELEVGRDLQYIRLNGTAVGALAGLAIHAVTVAF